MKKRKVKINEFLILLIFGLSWLVSGLIMFVVGILICIETFDYSDKIETTGVISQIIPYTDSDGDKSYHVYIKYYVNGDEYNSEFGGYSSSYYVGKEIKIYYDKNNVDEIGDKSLDLLFLMFPGFGLSFMGVGVILLIINNDRNRKKTKKKSNQVLK